MEKESKLSPQQVSQIGVVVKNVDEAVKYFSKLGFGPFRIITKTRNGAMVHGKPMDYVLRIAFGMFGGLELELIQVLKGRTIQKEFLDQNGEGLHHIGFAVKDVDAEVARWGEAGFPVLQRSREPDFAYIDTGRIGGVILELIDQVQAAESVRLNKELTHNQET